MGKQGTSARGIAPHIYHPSATQRRV